MPRLSRLVVAFVCSGATLGLLAVQLANAFLPVSATSHSVMTNLSVYGGLGIFTLYVACRRLIWALGDFFFYLRRGGMADTDCGSLAQPESACKLTTPFTLPPAFFTFTRARPVATARADDTQAMIERARYGEADHVQDALSLFVDFIAIFRRLLYIFGNDD